MKMHCPAPTGSCDVFDFSNPRARALFISECVNATKSGVVDGCFVDRAVDGTPTDSGDDRVPCSGADCRFKLNLTAAQSRAYAEGPTNHLPGPNSCRFLMTAARSCRSTPQDFCAVAYGREPRDTCVHTAHGACFTTALCDALCDPALPSAGHVKVLSDLQAALGEGPVIANHAYGPSSRPSRLTRLQSHCGF